MPVGTRGAVRTQTLGQLDQLGAFPDPREHLSPAGAPGPRGVRAARRPPPLDGLAARDPHRLGRVPGVLARRRPHVTEDGAAFRSAVDGSTILLTPERSIAMQRAIGSDIMMVLDQCIDATSPHAAARVAMELTHRWARRSLAARREPRRRCPSSCSRSSRARASTTSAATAPARSPTSAGSTASRSAASPSARAGPSARTSPSSPPSCSPPDRPRYLMGVGTPLDLLEAVHRGVDMFDCILPTAWAQQGMAFTSHGRIDLRRGVHKLAEQPLDVACACDACRLYTRSYLHHLVKCEEPLGWQLLAFHNLRFYLRLMETIRARIADDTFARVSRRAADAARARRPGQPAEPPAAHEAGPADHPRRVRGAGLVARLREHPARAVGRDHALGEPPRHRGRARLRRAVRAAPRRARRGAPARGLGRRPRRRAQRDGADPRARRRHRRTRRSSSSASSTTSTRSASRSRTPARSRTSATRRRTSSRTAGGSSATGCGGTSSRATSSRGSPALRAPT